MAIEADLLRDVLADPDSDEPRLAYAAWCAAQPDSATAARARLIEAQIDLARRGPDAPSARTFSLRCDIEDALAAHATAWIAPLSGLASTPVFDRGFIELCSLPARDFLAHADLLFALAPIRHLDLTSVIDVAEALFASPHLAKIRSLGLDSQGICDEHLELLAASPSLGELRWLSLNRNGITFTGADALAASASLPRLAYVRFLGNPFDPTEHQGHDQGIVVDSWLPPEGEALEAKHGPIRWLHPDARSLMDVVPDRFRIG